MKVTLLGLLEGRLQEPAIAKKAPELRDYRAQHRRAGNRAQPWFGWTQVLMPRNFWRSAAGWNQLPNQVLRFPVTTLPLRRADLSRPPFRTLPHHGVSRFWSI